MIPIARPLLDDTEAQAVADVLASGILTGGPNVAAFENEFAAFCGARHAVAVGSGTAALHVGLLALGIGAGDEVIVPSFTFAATANAVVMCGGVPVFVDIEPDTYCMDPGRVEEALSARTAAIMPVHLYGHPAPMTRLGQIAERAGVALVEDAAQAHGATWSGRPVGAFGSFAAFSFYPTKNMTTGEGGMITTDDPELAERARLLRNQGMDRRYHHPLVGLNERMTEIEAAIGLVQLAKLPAWNARRQANARFYDEALAGSVEVPSVRPEATHVYHQYTIRTPGREAVIKQLDAADIGYGIYYPLPTHLQPPFAAAAPALPVTERVAEEVLSIPVRPDLTDDERGRVAHTVLAALDR